MTAENSEVVVLGKQVSDLQSNVTVAADKSISGELAYVTDYTEFSSDPELQEGNFIALHWSDPQSIVTSLKVGIKNGTPMVECLNDPDRNGVFRILSSNNVFVIEQSDGTNTLTTEYPLSGIVLDANGEG